jgi:hypothetical protein
MMPVRCCVYLAGSRGIVLFEELWSETGTVAFHELNHVALGSNLQDIYMKSARGPMPSTWPKGKQAHVGCS